MAGIKFLLAYSENKFLVAIATIQCLITQCHVFFLDSWINIPINSRVRHGLQQTLYFRATTHYTTSNEYNIYSSQNHHFSKKFAATAKIGFYAIITQINTLSLYFQLQKRVDDANTRRCLSIYDKPCKK